MRVLVTGASGYIGNAVAKAFRNAGHHVLGLVRNENAASLLRKSEIEPVLGELSKPEIYAKAASDSNVLVHCAFENSKEGIAKDAKALEAMLGYLKENNLPKVFIYTSGIWVYGPTGSSIADESTSLHPIDLVKWRPIREEMTLKAASQWVKPIIIRPGLVYGGAGGLTGLWFQGSKQGSIPLFGDGSNHLSMIHVEDLAELYVAAAEQELGPLVLNAVDGHYPTAKECAEALSSYLKLPVQPISKEDTQAKLGPLAQGLTLDQKISAERAFRLLGWLPKHPGFIEGIQEYFNAWKQGFSNGAK